jgi:hypothetical protein
MSEIVCTSYKSVDKGTLQALINVFVPKWGLEIFGVQICMKNGHKWINFPSRMSEENGEKKYFPHLRFKEKTHMEAFTKKVLEAVDKYCMAQNQPNQSNFVEDEDIPF